MSWNDDIKKIIELIPKINAIYDEINKNREPARKPSETEELKRKVDATQSNANPVANYDDSQIKAEIKSLGASLGELYDDVLRIRRAESSKRTSQELAENFERELFNVNKKLKATKVPELYDGGELKREIARLSDSIPIQYDDKDLIKRLSKLEQVKPRKYDDSAIKRELQSLRKLIPEVYDDAEIKAEISRALKICESQGVTINSLSKEYGKISGLVNLVVERDKTIKDLKLDLKRAESSARNCEELMINMERRVNDLSARLTDGN